LPTVLYAWTSATSATLPATPNDGGAGGFNLPFTASTQQAIPAGLRRVNITSTTTQYLSGYAAFTVSTCAAHGYVGARRVR